MKQIRKDMQTVLKSLKTLTQTTEKMVRRLEKLEKTQAAGKARTRTRAKAKPAAKARTRAKVKTVAKARTAAKARKTRKVAPKRAGKKTAIDTVLSIIHRTRKGATINDLRKKTGLSDNHIRVILYRLKKRGQIKTESKGVYVKA